MSMKNHFERLFRYVAWADRRSLAAVRNTPEAQAEALPLMSHVLAAEHVWLSRLLQLDPRHPVWPTLTSDNCDKLAAENEAGYREFLARLEDDQLADKVHYRNFQGQEFTTAIVDILLQVITHGPYHRGQIAKIIAGSGGSPINTDFITFVRENEAND